MKTKQTVTPLEIYNKTDEIVSKFRNGKERYRTSALFNRTVQMLVRGASMYDVIEQLITVTDDTQKAFEQYINRDTRPMSMNLYEERTKTNP